MVVGVGLYLQAEIEPVDDSSAREDDAEGRAQAQVAKGPPNS